MGAKIIIAMVLGGLVGIQVTAADRRQRPIEWSIENIEKDAVVIVIEPGIDTLSTVKEKVARKYKELHDSITEKRKKDRLALYTHPHALKISGRSNKEMSDEDFDKEVAADNTRFYVFAR